MQAEEGKSLLHKDVVREKEKPKVGRCAIILCLIVGAILAIFFLVYFLALGTGDEEHVFGTVKNANCKAGSNSTSSIEVMTFNTFLIYCAGSLIACQDADKREARVGEISVWFKDRTEDVVLFQEVWSFHEELRQGMADAGFCNYAMTDEKFGSGLAIFSKFPIVEQDFRDWFDAFGIGDGLNPDPTNAEVFIADKGILYAKIQKDNNTSLHFFNLHTTSDTEGDNHQVRLKQYEVIREFVASKNIPSDELVLMGGDYNEDKNCSENTCDGQEGNPVCENQAYYNAMVDILSVDTPGLSSNKTFTYDTLQNTLLVEVYAGKTCSYYQLQLDYIFYSKKHLIPDNSSACDLIEARNPDGHDLSDHFPVGCTLQY